MRTLSAEPFDSPSEETVRLERLARKPAAAAGALAELERVQQVTASAAGELPCGAGVA
jgi:hypothetical protein